MTTDRSSCPFCFPEHVRHATVTEPVAPLPGATKACESCGAVAEYRDGPRPHWVWHEPGVANGLWSWVYGQTEGNAIAPAMARYAADAPVGI